MSVMEKLPKLHTHGGKVKDHKKHHGNNRDDLEMVNDVTSRDTYLEVRMNDPKKGKDKHGKHGKHGKEPVIERYLLLSIINHHISLIIFIMT